MTETARDKPWLFRTYAGHSTAAASNALYRANLARGQTGLSVAFDLPTQTGYDSDHPLARGEVGKVGVPVSHLGDMRALFDGIPLEAMNTSMTINATAAWLLALYVAARRGAGRRRRRSSRAPSRTTSSRNTSRRGTYVFPPEPSLKLIADVAEYCYRAVPKWNPMNVCSLPPAGGRRDARAGARLRARHRPRRPRRGPRPGRPPRTSPSSSAASPSSSTPASASSPRCARCAPSSTSGTRSAATRYGVADPKLRRFRYGVQVNSLGLTEQQPENNVYRILIEMLAVTLSKNARARAVQLPAWNEALGLPRPWDQQWSLRMQQIMAYETDLLEYGDLFDGNPAVEAKVEALKAGARAELARIDEMGGAVAAIDYMKSALVAANTARLARIEAGETIVVGVNRFTEAEPSPLTAGDGGILVVDPAVEAEQIARLARLARRPRRPRRRRRPRRPARRRGRDGAQRHARLDRRREGRRHHRRMGRRDARGLRRVPRPDRRRQGRERARRQPRRGPRRRRGRQRPPRPPDQVPRRQARPRRPLQRRRADRRARPRLRHGGASTRASA